ncbi:MAG: hypothetical protein ACMXYK_04705, partial [Candidatus Woesearchaeota archaeon]
MDDLKQKYLHRIKHEMTGSKDYQNFLSEFRAVPKSLYEKACAMSESMNVKPDPKTAAKIQEAADFASLAVTPTGVYSLAIVAPMLFVILATLLVLFVPDNFFLIMLIFVGGLSAIMPLLKMPFYIADSFRLRASNQMVLSIFYIVTYMRHTSNLERAIEFASDHLSAPLSTEFRKVIWDVEASNFDSIQESLEHFLSKWSTNNPEFADAIHLIEGSLLEGSEERRINSLEKALNLILDETYENMLHFAHNLQSPITTLHMLGIILPILGLVILPLMISFMGDDVAWYHVAVVYNVFLPIVVFLLGFKILSKRPSGYGETSLSSKEVQAALGSTVKIGSIDLKIKPKTFGFIFVGFFLLIGFSPLYLNALGVSDAGFGGENELKACGFDYCFLEYREDENGVVTGPFGIISTLLSLLIIMGIGVGIGLAYSFKSNKVLKIFEKSKALENEFSSSLFQLGNRLGDNIPAEVATLKVAESMPNSPSGKFFKVVSINIQKLGMGIQDAIYDPRVGALVSYPSNLIDSSMRVLVESAQKGPLIASNALLNISRYIKEMHKVEERLKDLMAEVISSMKSQINFLTPVISAVVVGITSMISSIIGALAISVSGAIPETATASAGISPEMLATSFSGGMPTFYFQLIVGLYVVQITYILTILVNTIENGADPIRRDDINKKNLVKSTLTYIGLTTIIVLLFEFVV